MSVSSPWEKKKKERLKSKDSESPKLLFSFFLSPAHAGYYGLFLFSPGSSLAGAVFSFFIF